ncbi:response regulator transcription factor [Lentzea sp. NBC_00516]|uniref:response regulator transcription factor n=1 Tax=Lentzea sp. NBC_00516 TaxID=2903582 RepID=UPI002E8142FA|nr:response regulator transcription factor [Lentzea sp. NBC_00516]WUD21120.1 response regulator transcription factor [Lentzea sp. NBC_00516]
MIRVLLVDDHPVVRFGLRTILEAQEDLTIVGECGSGSEAVRLASELQPDVVLMDLKMPGMDGATATAQVVASTSSRVVVLTTFDTDGDILRAIEAGATAYLLKDAPSEELISAVRAASRGQTVLASPVATKLVSAVQRPGLSAREAEVLGLVAGGLSNGAISQALNVSEATVKSHLLHVFTKLDVSDRTAAVTVAMSRGWLPPPV